MFIANATYTSEEFGETKIAISTDRETGTLVDESDARGLCRISYQRKIANEIMRTAATKELPAKFECNGVIYTLLKYTCNSEERFYNQYRKNHVSERVQIEKGAEVFVYTERCRCTHCYSAYGFDSIQSICGRVARVDVPKQWVEIDLQRCTHCSKYFIDNASLKSYEQQYGKLKIIQRRITGNEYAYESYRQDDNWFNPDSILSRNGYSTKLNKAVRLAILVDMMEHGIKKAEIIDTLSRFIYWRSDRCYNAAVIWKHDLDFVNGYELGSQPVVKFVYK